MKVEDCKDLRFFKNFAAFGIDNSIGIGVSVDIDIGISIGIVIVIDFLTGFSLGQTIKWKWKFLSQLLSQSVCLSMRLSVYQTLSVCPSVRLSVYPSVCRSDGQPVCLSLSKFWEGGGCSPIHADFSKPNQGSPYWRGRVSTVDLLALFLQISCFNKVTINTFYNTSNLNMVVNCTVPSHSVRVPCPILLMLLRAALF